jgi:hypothetical protein
MPNVVVAGAVIQCSHMGQVKLSGGDSRLDVSGAAAITFGMETGLSFQSGAPGVVVACQFPNPSPPPLTMPCASTLPATTGVSTLLTIGGAGVLLQNASGPAVNPADLSATWSIASPGQTLLLVEE